MMYRYNSPTDKAEPVLDLAKSWEMQPSFFVSAAYGCCFESRPP
jgi:hypothetical protein